MSRIFRALWLEALTVLSRTPYTAAPGSISCCSVVKKHGWHLSHLINSECYFSFSDWKLSTFLQVSILSKRLPKSPRVDSKKQQPKWALLCGHGHLVFWLSDPCGPLILWLSRTERGLFWSQLWNSQGFWPLLLKNNHHWSVRGSWHKKKEQDSYFQSLGEFKTKT